MDRWTPSKGGLDLGLFQKSNRPSGRRGLDLGLSKRANPYTRGEVVQSDLRIRAVLYILHPSTAHQHSHITQTGTLQRISVHLQSRTAKVHDRKRHAHARSASPDRQSRATVVVDPLYRINGRVGQPAVLAAPSTLYLLRAQTLCAEPVRVLLRYNVCCSRFEHLC